MLTLKRASKHADLIEVVLHAHMAGAAKLRTDVNKVQHAVHTHRMAWLAEGQLVSVSVGAHATGHPVRPLYAADGAVSSPARQLPIAQRQCQMKSFNVQACLIANGWFDGPSSNNKTVRSFRACM